MCDVALITASFPFSVSPIFRLTFERKQDLLQQQESPQERRRIQEKWIISFQNEKAQLFPCPIVTLPVNLIYRTGIRNDVINRKD